MYSQYGHLHRIGGGHQVRLRADEPTLLEASDIDMSRKNISSGAVWEPIVGYSRAVRVDRHVFVAGTTATDANGQVVGKGDAARQARFVLEKIEAALLQAGASLNDVVRTRMFVTDIANWEAVGRVHGEYFGKIRPASTMVEVSRLIDLDHLVEIEADAYIAA